MLTLCHNVLISYRLLTFLTFKRYKALTLNFLSFSFFLFLGTLKRLLLFPFFLPSFIISSFFSRSPFSFAWLPNPCLSLVPFSPKPHLLRSLPFILHKASTSLFYSSPSPQRLAFSVLLLVVSHSLPHFLMAPNARFAWWLSDLPPLTLVRIQLHQGFQIDARLEWVVLFCSSSWLSIFFVCFGYVKIPFFVVWWLLYFFLHYWKLL